MTYRTEQSVVHAERLSRSFGDPTEGDGTVAVDQLTVDVYQGEVFGLLGHNGAGKTTTVRLLNGILTPTGGSLRVLGYDPISEGPLLRRHTGVLTETPSLDEKLSGWENLAIYARLYGVEERSVKTRVGELLEAFGLAERATELAGAYSKGMKQRLALARTLLHDPPLLFLDEPTAGLDPVAARSVRELITSLSQRGEHTVILCTHNLIEAQRLCHRVAVLEHGRLVALGTPSQLARDLQHGIRLTLEVDAWDPAALPLPTAARDVTWNAGRSELSLWVPDRAAIADLVAAFVQAGRRVYQVAPHELTLEDVYFVLHEQAEGAETP